MPRFAVLHDVAGEESRPVGIVLEMPDHVLVLAPKEYGIPERHDGAYRVFQPDATFVAYQPGDSAYFDHVLIDLSCSFGIGEQGICVDASLTTLLQLIVEKIERERSRVSFGEYETARGGRTGTPLRVLSGGRPPAYQPARGVAERELALSARAIVTV